MWANLNLLKQFNLICPVQSYLKKFFRFAADPNQIYIPDRPTPHRGAFRDRHGRWVRDAVDASGAADESAGLRTAKSCGPDAPTLASSWRRKLRRRGWQESQVTRESTKESVKTIARGMPGVTGVTVVTTLVCFLFSHTRLRAH